MFKVVCTKSSCDNSFYIFRSDDKVPAKGLKCLDCEVKDRLAKMPLRQVRRNGSNFMLVSVGVTDEADAKLVRCEDE
jgi:hypothetical protein